MKRLLLVTSAAALLATAAVFSSHTAWSAPDEATFAGDTVHSFVLFKVKHLGVSWSYGRFNDFTVSAQMAADGSAVSSVAFVVKTDSVDTGLAKRDQHIKNPDFFNAKQFPEISFKSTKTKAIDADTTEVTGDLSMHGVTKPITVNVVKVGAGKGMAKEDLVGLESTFTVKRSDFDMTNMVGPVGDDVTITVATELAKK